MGKLDGALQFTGSIEGMSAYKMRGSDKIILRSKGGATKEQIKRNATFKLTRLNNAEFGGRSKSGKMVRHMLESLQPLADHNMTGPVNSLLRPIQVLDTVNPLGQRNVLLTRNPKIFEGYPINRTQLFDSIIRNGVESEIVRDDLRGTISIPALVPGVNFFAPWKAPMYSFIGVFGTIADFQYVTKLKGYEPVGKYDNFHAKEVKSDWFWSSKSSAAFEMELTALKTPPNNSFSLLLAIGIRFGNMVDDNTIVPVKYAGSGKILTMG